MAQTDILLAGFGGQGILFAGKVIATCALIDGRQVSWLPSYGPEMRGGTANCAVCLSDEPIGSPLVLAPKLLIVMNNPSYDKFIDTVVPGGTVVVNSSLVDRVSARTDIKVCYVPATQLANENELQSLANMICLGRLLAETGFAAPEVVDQAIVKCVPAKKAFLLDGNRRAIRMGIEYRA